MCPEDCSEQVANVIQDLLSYIAALKGDKESWDDLDREVPRQAFGARRTEPLKQQAKFKQGWRDRSPVPDNGSVYTVKTPEEAERRRDYVDQYYQGLKITDPKVKGSGCGTYLLGTDYLPFKLPMAPRMRIEIMSGFDKKAGSIRLCHPGTGEDDIFQPIMLIPVVQYW